jgi:hypothetical protein
MLQINRKALEELRQAQWVLREKLAEIWENEEDHNTSRIRGHEYTQKMTEQATSEEGAMEHASNLMDNVLDAIDDALAQEKAYEHMES